MLKKLLAAPAFCFLAIPALAQGLIIGQPGQGLIIQNGGSSTLTIGTTAISGGTLNNCLTVGASGKLGQGSCGTTYTAGSGLTLSGSAFSLGDANLTYSAGALSTGSLTLTTPLAASSGGTGISSLGSNVATALGLTLNGSGAVSATTSPTFVTPILGAATGTSLALGGSTLGSNALAVTGTTLLSGVVSVQNGTTAESLSVYNTYSAGGTNYERCYGGGWQNTTNVCSYGTTMGGTGVARNLQFLVGGVNKLDYGATNIGDWTLNAPLYTVGIIMGSGSIISGDAVTTLSVFGGGTPVVASNQMMIAPSHVSTTAAATTSAGQISYGGTTAALSNCGSAVLTTATACVVINVAGTTHYIPYY